MNGTATIGRLGLALGVLVAMIVTGILVWCAVRSEHDGAVVSIQAKARLESPSSTPRLQRVEESHDELGAVASRNEAPPERIDEPVDEVDDTSETEREWRLLGASALERNRERPTRGFIKHRIVHFTFDDGPHLENTPRLLDALGEYGIHATFFVVGRQLGGPHSLERRALVQRMEGEGHTVAVHTNAHPDLSRLSREQIDQDLDRVETSLEATLGYRPGIFRPPYGRRSSLSNAVLRERGYTQVLWNMPPEQGARSSDDIVRNFTRTLDRMDRHPRGPGGVVLMHDPQENSVDAFPELIEELRQRNCELLNREGEELWVIADDLRPFLLDEGEPPAELLEQLQNAERQRAAEYCADHVTTSWLGELP